MEADNNKKDKTTKDKDSKKEEKINEIKPDTRPELKKKRVFVPIITIIIFLISAVFYSIHNYFYKSTDDAFVEGHIVSIAPRVSGQVVNLKIDDNMEVKKGDLLLEIDPNDYRVKFEQSKADFEENTARLQQAKNELLKTKSELDFAKNDYERYSKLYRKEISSKQDFEASKTKFVEAQMNYKNSKAKYDEISASSKKMKSKVEEDKLNLSYTKIYAPQDGLITNRTVEEGNFVQKAQPLFSIVPEKVWVVANFKETQIANMKKGQKVKIKIDTFGSKKFSGEVESIQRSTGAKASLFPPENAVGSYVKIVQRVPVKIIFTDDISKYNIVPGMSVVPTVKVR